MKISNREILSVIDFGELSDRNTDLIHTYLDGKGSEDYKPFIFIDFDERKFHKFSMAHNFAYHLTSISYEAMMIGKFMHESGMAGRSMIIAQGHDSIIETGLVPDEFLDMVQIYVELGVLPEDFTPITEEDIEGFGVSDYEVGPQYLEFINVEDFAEGQEGPNMQLKDAPSILRKIYEDPQDYYLVNHDQCQYVNISKVEMIYEKNFGDYNGYAILPFMYYLVDPTTYLDSNILRSQYYGVWFGDNVEIVRGNTPGFDFALYESGYDYEEVSMPLQGQGALNLNIY